MCKAGAAPRVKKNLDRNFFFFYKVVTNHVFKFRVVI